MPIAASSDAELVTAHEYREANFIRLEPFWRAIAFQLEFNCTQ